MLMLDNKVVIITILCHLLTWNQLLSITLPSFINCFRTFSLSSLIVLEHFIFLYICDSNGLFSIIPSLPSLFLLMFSILFSLLKWFKCTSFFFFDVCYTVIWQFSMVLVEENQWRAKPCILWKLDFGFDWYIIMAKSICT